MASNKLNKSNPNGNNKVEVQGSGWGDGYVAGVDLGGTKTLCSIINKEQKIIARSKLSTPTRKGAAAVVKNIVETVKHACEDAGIAASQLKGIGIGGAGPVDAKTGVVLIAPNMGFKNFALAEKVKELTGVPVRVENDVNAGVWGEYRFGGSQRI